MIKRKEFQQRKLAGACITEAEANANDRADLKDRGENKRFFPPTTMIWTTIQKAEMEDTFFNATGAYPEEEEEEFLCRAEARKINLWDDGKTGDKVEVLQVESECSMYRPECHDMQTFKEDDTVWQQEYVEDTVWQQEPQRHGLPLQDEELLKEERRLWQGRTSRGSSRWSSVVQGQTKSTREICKVDTRPENQTQFKKNAENNKLSC